MSDDEPEILGWRKQVDALQLGPRKRPYVYRLCDALKH